MTTYKKYTHLEHILARPDTYVGSLKPDNSSQWVFENDKIIQKNIRWVPGLYKIYDEILVNAIDQCAVDNSVDVIKVDIVKEPEFYVTILNNGNGIPINKQNDVYIPEMIFGQLLTSSNYDDTQERTTGGRNGYGAKLANVFSDWFEIDIGNPETKRRYIQKWTKNMTTVDKPQITKYSKTKGYVQIKFCPDLKKFDLSKITDDIIALFTKRVYDACACTPEKTKIYLNGKNISIKSFEKYTELYTSNKKIVDLSNERWKVVLSTSETFKQVSFVNGISTTIGGSHIDSVLSQIIKKLTEYLTLKHKELKLKPGYIKDHLFLFVNSVIVNPSFSSQTKEECTTRYKDFGSRCEISDEFIKKIAKLDIIDDIVALAKHKETRELNKTDGKKKSIIKGIPKLEDATKAGTVNSNKCTLILTEGDSAKTFAISGLGVVGREYYGVFPLKGKLLNVRDASINQLLHNDEINNIKQIVGLSQGKEYNSVNELRYGKIMILTDADVDGSHIKGLFINFIHYFWPSLLSYNPSFLVAMRTPIIKVSKGVNIKSFYNCQDYEKWKRTNNTTNWKIKYYKGLGTSTANEAKDYFREMNKNVVSYSNDDKTAESIDLAFKKSLANSRKKWLTEHKPIETEQKNNYTFTEFVDNELIWFSLADNIRSIPNVMDGLKPSQRKVLYACKKRNNTEVKVSQVCGYISTETCYHHGEQSLMSTVINMAQDYVGSNNINLLEPIGQFGTRLMGGKDAASPRYIFTKLNQVADKLFDNRDAPLLKYNDDDGTVIEPKYYVPILPMVLINGSDGIGTGFSTNLPCFNPIDVKNNVVNMLCGKEPIPMTPWYKGFDGTITYDDNGKYTTSGIYKYISKDTVEITELPIGKWTSDFKEFVDGLLSADKIKGYENHSSETKISFKITFKQNPDDVISFLKLSTSINTNNIHLFDENETIKKYTIEQILSEFIKGRMNLYSRRKTHILSELQTESIELTEKMRFIKLVIEGSVDFLKQPTDEIIKKLDTHKFNKNIHNCLLDMKISQFTLENVNSLQTKIDKCNKEFVTMTAKTINALWLDDLSMLK